MQNFRLANNITGWLIFAIAAALYILTMEPVSSFWDCGEFIAASYKLEVPHPPGAPLFLLIGRMFSFLAGGDLSRIGYFVNMVSALSSAGSSLLLFWTITMLARKLTGEIESAASPRGILVLFAGAVGALAYTFSDSAWFSAVEAEVYAMSSLFTALVIWAMLRWERVADEPNADRWLLLIAYFTGLSIGVHLLNLVAMPALAYIYYFRRSKHSQLGMLTTFVVGLVMLGAIMVGIIPGLPTLANVFELSFVNSFGLPFNSGILFFLAMFIGLVLYLFRYSVKTNRPQLYNGLWAFVFVMIGYATYGIIVVRATHKPPINENDPSNALSMVSYLKREQYGDRPLLYGPVYNSQPEKQEKGAPIYMKGDKKYDVISNKTENVYSSKEKVFLPRIYSPQANHIRAYKNWVKLPSGDRKPSLGTNLAFMFKYQIGHMYIRYFMWNFAGRESDVQDAGWLTPASSTTDLPEALANNKARNQFFMFPLILGLAGIYLQYTRKRRDLFIVGLLFFFTGIAIVIYLNQPPIEPRERDYTFAGSFYAFSIWIGLGVIALYELLAKLIKNEMARATISGAFCMGVPLVMISAGYDDHNRSNRYHSVDSAKNLLASCAPNAILFTGGDNDTFPLWYAQEVEGFRTDIRVCNLSLLGTDWYAKQMLLQAYDSKPLPMVLKYKNFGPNKNDYLPFVEIPEVKSGLDLSTYIKLIAEENQAVTRETESGNSITIMPTKVFSIPVDIVKVKRMGIVPAKDSTRIVSNITWNIGKGALYKSDMLMLDMIAHSNWERPIYFSTTLAGSNYLNLREYMYLEGLAYRLLPVKNTGAQEGVVNAPVMYENMMKKMAFRGLDEPNSYFDENYKRFPLNARKSFYMLAAQYMNDAEQDSLNAAQYRAKALEVTNYCLKVMPDTALHYDFYMPQFIPILLRLGERKRADQMASLMANRASKDLDYYSKQTPISEYELQTNAFILQQIAYSYRQAGINDLATTYNQLFERYAPILQNLQGSGGGGEEEE
jgi:hypothetical protein